MFDTVFQINKIRLQGKLKLGHSKLSLFQITN